MLSHKAYLYVKARARGMTPVEAYMETHPGSTRDSAVDNYKRFEENEEVALHIQEFIEADKSEAAEVRREVVAGYLHDSRNPELPLAYRFKARDALVKIYGLEAKKEVEVSADEEFRRFLMGQSDGK